MSPESVIGTDKLTSAGAWNQYAAIKRLPCSTHWTQLPWGSGSVRPRPGACSDGTG